MKKQKIKKFLIVTLILIESFIINIPVALALSIPSVSSIASQLEKRYHLNLQSIQNQGETFNVADTKKVAPQVHLFFNPADPKPGEKLTAEALPIYFGNAKESLYYTWYLKHKECDIDKDGSLTDNQKKICDRDDNNKVDENDWKIEAMRIITRGDFDLKKANYSHSYDDKDRDGDGYKAIWGGDDRDKRLDDFDNDYEITPTSGNNSDHEDYAYCYVHDFRDGVNYELNDASHSSFSCPAGTTAKCVTDEELACSNIGGSFTEYKVCKDIGESPSCSGTAPACNNGNPLCVPDLADYDCDTNIPASYSAASCATVSGGATPTCSVSSSSGGPGRNLCKHLFSYYNNFDGNIDYLGTPNDTSDDFRITDQLDDEIIGDGKFKEGEEAFWRTNPEDPNTADNGQMDEANATGLGINSFTWNYQLEDQLGVAVEGVSMIPTKHAGQDEKGGASMMIMWAMPKNDCPIQNKDSYHQTIKGYRVKIPTADMDLNDCLKRNLVDPREGDQPRKLEVGVSYSPEFPVNDPSEDNSGDSIIAQASVENSSRDSNELYYDWAIEASPDASFNSEIWIDITNELVDNKLFSGPIKGNGIASINLKLNLNKDVLDDFSDYFPQSNGGIGYLKISVVVKENYSSGTSREGKSDVIVKVISSGDKINAYVTKVVQSGGEEKMDIDGSYLPICQDPATKRQTPLCYMLKNEIVGVKVENDGSLDNFSWTINGKPLICDSSVSSLCLDEKQNEYNFFPVTDDPGETYVISVSANNITTGKTIQLSRTFRVVEPFIKIISADENSVWPRYLGDYVDLDGNFFPDMSDSIFETFLGNIPVLKAEFHPGWLRNYLPADQLDLEWIIDGTEEGADDMEQVTLPAVDKGVGSVYNISVNAIFRNSLEMRRVLKNIWNISQFDSTEKYLSSSIQIEVVKGEGEAELLTFNNPRKIMAALFSNFPSQFVFMFRMALTILVILVITGIVFNLTPKNYEDDEAY